MQSDEHILIQCYKYANVDAIIINLFCYSPLPCTHMQNHLNQISHQRFLHT